MIGQNYMMQRPYFTGGIDFSHPLARGLIGASCYASMLPHMQNLSLHPTFQAQWDLIHRVFIPVSQAASGQTMNFRQNRMRGWEGASVSSSLTPQRNNYDLGVKLTSGSDASIVGMISRFGNVTAVTRGAAPVALLDASGNALIELCESTGSRGRYWDSAAAEVFAGVDSGGESGASSSKQVRFVGAAYTNGVGIGVYGDNGEYKTASNTNNLSAAPAVFQPRGGTTNSSASPIAFAWARALSKAEFEWLRDDVWVLFEKRPRYRPYYTPSGAAFDPALMASMWHQYPDTIQAARQASASGMTPPEFMPN